MALKWGKLVKMGLKWRSSVLSTGLGKHHLNLFLLLIVFMLQSDDLLALLLQISLETELKFLFTAQDSLLITV